LLKIRPSRKVALAWATLVIGLLATVLGGLQVKQGITRDAVGQFAFVSDQVTLKTCERLNAYALILRGGAALFAASTAVDRQAWRAYVEGLMVKGNIPGVQGIGYAQAIPPDQLAAHIARLRGEGFPDYSVRPPGGRELYTSIIYVEPFRDRNLRALGFDMYSEPVRRTAMERARDTGLAALSAKVALEQETGTDVEAGVLMYVPVYRNGMPANDAGQRQAALLGWVYSPFRMSNLMGGWDRYADKTVDLHIYVGTEATPASLLFESKPAATPDVHSLLYQRRTINMNGQLWLLEFDSTPAAQAISYAPVWAVLAAGFALSVLLSGLMFAVINTLANAARIAQGLTAQIRQREKLLRESEERLRIITTSAQDAIIMLDAAGLIAFWNQAAERLFGYSWEEAVGRDLHTLIVPPHYREAHQKAFTHFQRTGQGPAVGKTVELTGLRRDGSEFPLALSLSAVWMKDAWHSIGLLRDITERKQASEALEMSEQRFRKLLQEIPSVAVQGYGSDGTTLYWNEASEWLYGFSEEEAVGRNILDLIIPPPMRQAVIDAMDNMFKTGQPIPAGELSLMHKDGSRVDVFSSHAYVQVPGGKPEMFCVDIDLTARKQAEEKLQLAASVFTHAREGIMITSADGTIIEVNDAFSQITSYSRHEVLGKNPHILSSGRQGKEYYAVMWRKLVDEGHWFGEVWNRRKNGECYAVKQTISAVCDAQGNTRNYVALLSDITQIKEHEQRLEHIAHYDALTGLPNRVLLADRLHQGMVHALRHSHALAVAFLDLDGFKAINDRHGHEAGDQLLIAVATHMKQSLREGDTLARIGGDEFVAMLSDLTDIEASVPIITRILAAAAQPVQFGDITLQVSASLGVTFYPRMEDIDADQLLRQADQAMYQAKLAGKNCYHFFDDEHDRSIRGHHESLEGIRHALSEREFVLYFQPKVNMRLGTVIGAEALIRWQHPERGLLPPSVFLPVIEDHPLAVEIGEWVIDSALTQMERWHAAGLDIPVSVNVGARQLLQADFVGRLRGILASHPNFRPGYLELEVLETSALEDLVRASQVIEECRGIGVVFDLDDFGTGYSSLTYLKRLPITHLKIDQSFVRDMLDDPDDLAILEGVIGLSAAFRRQVIAEGVETVEHGEMLLQLGCELAQGYGIARPMPTGELPLWAASWRPDPAWVGLPPVNRDDLPLLYASVEHRAWIVALESQLRGLRETAPGIDRQQCRFGAWLASGGRARYDAQPAFAEVERLHSQVHGLAAELGGLQSQGPGPETLARLGELLRLHDALLAQMKRLMQDNQR
jgi:diguanylate cyclase (GGDEF)-like protein/PAS domain S-box-containing protein